jgi:hypothetical protein
MESIVDEDIYKVLRWLRSWGGAGARFGIDRVCSEVPGGTTREVIERAARQGYVGMRNGLVTLTSKGEKAWKHWVEY